MDLTRLRTQLERRWWIVVVAAVLAAIGAGVASAGQADDHERTIHFVLRPDASVTADDLPGTLDALQSDGPLVQSVLGVLGSREMLRRAAAEAGVPYSAEYGLEATGRPGSALIDSTVAAADEEVLERLVVGYAREASSYVAASYSAYVLARLSIDSGGTGTGPSTAQVVILAFLAGAVIGVGLVAAEPLLARARPAVGARVPLSRADQAGNGRRVDEPRLVQVESFDSEPQERAPPAESTPGQEPAPRRELGPSPDAAPAREPLAEPTASPEHDSRPKPATRAKRTAKAATRPKSKTRPKPAAKPPAGPKPKARAKSATRPKRSSAPPVQAEPEPVAAAGPEPATRTDPKRATAKPASAVAAEPKPAATAEPEAVAEPEASAEPGPRASEPELAGTAGAERPSTAEPVAAPKPDTRSKPAAKPKPAPRQKSANRRRTPAPNEDED
jgi:hypothetical protein